MEFTLSITGSNAADLQQVLAAFSGTGIQINSTAANNTKKEKKSMSDDAAGPAMPAVETKTETPAPAANGTVTIEQVRASVKAKADSGKREEVKTLLTEFGADSVTKLDVSKYAAFVEKLNAL